MNGDTKVNLGPFATLFVHGLGFFNDQKAWSRGPDSAFRPAWRFSTCFGRVGGPTGCATRFQQACGEG